MTGFISPLIVFYKAWLTVSIPMNKYSVLFIQLAENGVL